MSKTRENLAKVYGGAMDSFRLIKLQQKEANLISLFMNKQKEIEDMIDGLSKIQSKLISETLPIQESMSKFIDENSYLRDQDFYEQYSNVYSELVQSYMEFTKDFSCAKDKIYDIFINYRTGKYGDHDQFDELIEALKKSGVDVHVLADKSVGLDDERLRRLTLSSSDYQLFSDVVSQYEKSLNEKGLDFIDELSVYFVPPFINRAIDICEMKEMVNNLDDNNGFRYNMFGLSSSQVYGDNYLSENALRGVMEDTFRVMLSKPTNYHNYAETPWVWNDGSTVDMFSDVERSSFNNNGVVKKNKRSKKIK